MVANREALIYFAVTSGSKGCDLMGLRNLLLALTLVSTSTAAFAAPDGDRLFARHCAACHGMEGEGGVGVPLALPSFLTNVSDEFLFKTIRNGRPGRVMPAFRTLSDAQIQAIVGHIRGWMPAGSKGIPHGDGKVTGRAENGKVLFAEHCASCHGENGEGGAGTGVTFSRPRDLPIMPPALNNPGFLAAASDQMIKATLMEGREGTPMVSFLKQGLSETDINDIVAYVRSFEEHPKQWQPPQVEDLVLEMESSYSLEETVENIKRAAVGKNFRVIRVQTLESGLVPAEQENKKQIVVYFCNFSFINRALSLDPRVGLFMPCRVTAIEQDGVVKIMAINPRYLSRLYNNAELDESCRTMYDTYYAILEEATL